jgi:hypothetical protein
VRAAPAGLVSCAAAHLHCPSLHPSACYATDGILACCAHAATVPQLLRHALLLVWPLAWPCLSISLPPGPGMAQACCCYGPALCQVPLHGLACADLSPPASGLSPLASGLLPRFKHVGLPVLLHQPGDDDYGLGIAAYGEVSRTQDGAGSSYMAALSDRPLMRAYVSVSVGAGSSRRVHCTGAANVRWIDTALPACLHTGAAVRVPRLSIQYGAVNNVQR